MVLACGLINTKAEFSNTLFLASQVVVLVDETGTDELDAATLYCKVNAVIIRVTMIANILMVLAAAREEEKGRASVTTWNVHFSLQSNETKNSKVRTN